MTPNTTKEYNKFDSFKILPHKDFRKTGIWIKPLMASPF